MVATDQTGSSLPLSAVRSGRADGGLAIEVVDLVKRYGPITALAGLTLTVTRGEVIGFLGPNGAGKTTAVKLLLGLARPSAGQGSVLGAAMGNRASRGRIGYLPELFRYQEWLTGREVLTLHCELAAIPRARWAGEVGVALDTVGLLGRADDRVGGFSKGMQQRLGLGVALVGAPELVFLDEPTSALDPVGRHDVREAIRALKQRGTTVFLNSHLLTEVEQVCDSVAVVDHGRVIARGSMANILGGSTTVRLHAADLTDIGETTLRRFGECAIEGDWYTFRGVAAEDIPALVAAVVQLGGRVYAVEPASGTLEDRFLELLQETDGR